MSVSDYSCAQFPPCSQPVVVVYQGHGHGGIYGSCADHKPWENPADGKPKPLSDYKIIHGEA